MLLIIKQKDVFLKLQNVKIVKSSKIVLWMYVNGQIINVLQNNVLIKQQIVHHIRLQKNALTIKPNHLV